MRIYYLDFWYFSLYFFNNFKELINCIWVYLKLYFFHNIYRFIYKKFFN
ncbi:hypothetical protein, partial [Plasmodium yoelii yoelii]